MTEDTGCQQLWAACLLNALNDLNGNKTDANCSIYSNQRYAQEAKEWFESDADGIGSFRFICQIFSLDVLAARQAIFDGEIRFESDGPDPDSLPCRLAEFRRQFRISQGRIADEIGMAVSSISCVETGRTNEHAMRADHRERIINYMTEFEELHEPDFVCQR